MKKAFDKILSKKEVEKLITDTNGIINSKEFDFNKNISIVFRDINKDFIFENSISKNDIINILSCLKIENYLKSVLDTIDIEPIFLHEFAIEYNGIKYVYLKYKIKEKLLSIKIVSIHKNEFKPMFPYK